MGRPETTVVGCMDGDGDEKRPHCLGCTQHLEISEPWQVWERTCGFRKGQGRLRFPGLAPALIARFFVAVVKGKY